MAEHIEAISWQDDHIRILDQTRLPEEEIYLACRDLDEICEAIKRLSIRGAPAIGITAAMGLAFAARRVDAVDTKEFLQAVDQISAKLMATRPTAVNLRWALDRMKAKLKEASPEENIAALKEMLQREACIVHDEDISINRRIGEHGQRLLPQKAVVITICNTGSLATGGHGTALGVVRSAAAQGKDVFVAACETRPLLQGARLTAWELQKDGIPFALITDSMAGYYMRRKGADVVIAGADRIAGNGDAANKIGTYSLALLAQAHGIPFYIAAPLSTIDMTLRSGEDIPIEERDADEITSIKGRRIAPLNIPVWNPAFDVVPGSFIAGIITEEGVITRPYTENLARLF